MGNCIKTKFNGSYNGDLPIYEAVRIYVNREAAAAATNSNRQFSVAATEANKITLTNIGGQFLDDNGNPIGTTKTITTEDTSTWISYSSDTECIVLKNKQYLKRMTLFYDTINLMYTNLEDVKYCNNLESLHLGGQIQGGNLCSIRRLNLVSFTSNYCSIEGNLSDFSNSINLGTLTLFSGSNQPKIVGDFNSLVDTHAEGTINVRTDSSQIKCNGVSPLDALSSQNFKINFDGQGGVAYSL